MYIPRDSVVRLTDYSFYIGEFGPVKSVQSPFQQFITDRFNAVVLLWFCFAYCVSFGDIFTLYMCTLYWVGLRYMWPARLTVCSLCIMYTCICNLIISHFGFEDGFWF